MGDSPQFKSKEDGCIYVFDYKEKKWYKFCPAETLPIDVKAQVREAQNEAELILSLPL